MKKKLFAFLLILTSVIACMVSLTACNNSGNGVHSEYIGNYELVKKISITYKDGEVIEYGLSHGANVGEEFYNIQVKSSGIWLASDNSDSEPSQTIAGTWKIADSKLVLSALDGTVFNAEFDGEILQVSQVIRNEKFTGVELYMEFKRAV